MFKEYELHVLILGVSGQSLQEMPLKLFHFRRKESTKDTKETISFGLKTMILYILVPASPPPRPSEHTHTGPALTTLDNTWTVIVRIVLATLTLEGAVQKTKRQLS